MAEICPTQRVELGDSLTDDEVLELTRRTRVGILNEQTKRFPTSTDEWAMIHQNLSALETGAHRSKQLKQEDKNSGASIAAAREMAKSIVEAIGGRDVYSAKTVAEYVDIPDPTTAIAGTATPAPGELNTADDTGNFKEFSETRGKEVAERRRAEAEKRLSES